MTGYQCTTEIYRIVLSNVPSTREGMTNQWFFPPRMTSIFYTYIAVRSHNCTLFIAQLANRSMTRNVLGHYLENNCKNSSQSYDKPPLEQGCSIWESKRKNRRLKRTTTTRSIPSQMKTKTIVSV